MFTANEIGCIADGSFGHAHVRERLADLLVHMFRHHPRGGDGVHWAEAAPLVAELRAEPSDDYSEEDDAIGLLNEHAVSWEVLFSMEDGDLMLVATDDYYAAGED